MNLISWGIVNKLEFSTEKHPRPYKVACIDHTSLLVLQKCLLNLRINSYKDSNGYDVIPMKVTHPAWKTMDL